jgi:hypothetical protein
MNEKIPFGQILLALAIGAAALVFGYLMLPVYK